MDPSEIALFSRVFHLPAEITITSVDPSPTELGMGVACQAPVWSAQSAISPQLAFMGAINEPELSCLARVAM